jgi:putative type I site-specific restriction-modification system, S subunit
MISIFTVYSDICKISAPAHWQIRRFKDIITSSRSGIWGDEEKGDANDIVCYRVADFDYSNLCLKFDNITYRNVLPEQANEKLLSKGDLLLEKSGGGEKMPVGRVVLVNSPLRAVCSNFIQALSVNKKQSARFVLYLFHSIYSNRINTLFFNQTTGIQNLKTAHYLAQEIFLPPYSEQEAIAAYLDKECEKIGRKIELLERKADAYSRLRRSLINRAVTRGLEPNTPMKSTMIPWIGAIPAHWSIKRGKSLFKEVSRAVRPEDGVVTCFRNGEVTLRTNRRITGFTESEQEIGYHGVRIGDLVIHQMDAFAGAIGISDSDGKCSPICIVCREINSSEVDLKYYCQLLRVMSHRGYIQALAKGIRERTTDFRYKTLASLHFPAPPIEEQKEIAAYLDEKCAKIDAILEKINTEVERLKELKRSLINEVVTGQRAIDTESHS